MVGLAVGVVVVAGGFEVDGTIGGRVCVGVVVAGGGGGGGGGAVCVCVGLGAAVGVGVERGV